MKFRFLHLADVYLGCKNFHLAEKARERSEDFRLTFRSAVEYALEPRHGIDAVLIAGNLFEYHRPEEELWNYAKGLLSRLLAKDILVAMVPGQHDSYAYKNSVYRTERLPGVDLFLNTAPEAPRVHDVGGTRVFLYGLAYVPGQTPTPLPPFRKVEERGIHVGLLHGCATDHPEWVARPHQLDLDLDALGASGLDYLALGGVRGFSERRVGETTAVYPGSLEGRGFETGDLEDKGAVVVEIDDDGVHLERLILNRRRVECRTIDLRAERITDAEGLENAIATLSGPDRIVRVVLTGTAEFVADLEGITEKLADGFFHLEIVDESRLMDSALLGKIESENTIRGYFVRKLAARIEAIKKKIVAKGQTPESMRELETHELAMKIGVEQFIEDEAPPDSIYSLIPDSDEVVQGETLRETMEVENLEQRVKAMLEYRRQKNAELDPERGNGAAPAPPEGVTEREEESA